MEAVAEAEAEAEAEAGVEAGAVRAFLEMYFLTVNTVLFFRGSPLVCSKLFLQAPH